METSRQIKCVRIFPVVLLFLCRNVYSSVITQVSCLIIVVCSCFTSYTYPNKRTNKYPSTSWRVPSPNYPSPAGVREGSTSRQGDRELRSVRARLKLVPTRRRSRRSRRLRAGRCVPVVDKHLCPRSSSPGHEPGILIQDQGETPASHDDGGF